MGAACGCEDKVDDNEVKKDMKSLKKRGKGKQATQDWAVDVPLLEPPELKCEDVATYRHEHGPFEYDQGEGELRE